MEQLKTLEAEMLETPDKQLSLTDPDARSMITSGRGSGTVGYNVQASIDANHHLIVDHEVTNSGLHTDQLSKMAKGAKAAMGTDDLTVAADRGYFEGEQLRACDEAAKSSGILASGRALVNKPFSRAKLARFLRETLDH